MDTGMYCARDAALHCTNFMQRVKMQQRIKAIEKLRRKLRPTEAPRSSTGGCDSLFVTATENAGLYVAKEPSSPLGTVLIGWIIGARSRETLFAAALWLLLKTL